MRYRPPAHNWQKNRFSKAKLLGSKWTALPPQQARLGAQLKHFMVVGWHDETANSPVLELEAVLTRRIYRLDYRELKDANRWKMGWH